MSLPIGAGPVHLGRRKTVFDRLPFILYVPALCEVSFRAETTCETAERRSPSEARLEPKVITSSDLASSLRGGRKRFWNGL